jgi:hypothetical protein
MQSGLAEAWRSRVAGQAAESTERLVAESNLAWFLVQQGKAVEAEPMFRRLHEVLMRVHRAEHPNTLTAAGNLAMSLSKQGKYAEAERIEREVLEVRKRVLGAEHPDTQMIANNLAMSLKTQGKYAEAERMLHAALASCQRVIGPAHPRTRSGQHATWRTCGRASAPGRRWRSAIAARRHSRAHTAARRQARTQWQVRARAVVRRAHLPVYCGAGRREGAVAQGRVRGSGRVRGGGMCVGGGEQRVLSGSMPGGAVMLARVPAHGLEGAQAGVHGGTAILPERWRVLRSAAYVP